MKVKEWRGEETQVNSKMSGNERECAEAGYEIFHSLGYRWLKYFMKADCIIAVVHSSYFKGSLNNWISSDISREILTNSNAVYIYSQNDSLAKIEEVFHLYQKGFRTKKYAFVECPLCHTICIAGGQ